jgi:hypothetical protein
LETTDSTYLESTHSHSIAGTVTTNVQNGRRGYKLQHVSTTIDGHQKMSNLFLLFNKSASEAVVLKYGIFGKKKIVVKSQNATGLFCMA